MVFELCFVITWSKMGLKQKDKHVFGAITKWMTIILFFELQGYSGLCPPTAPGGKKKNKN